MQQRADNTELFAGGGEMGRLMRAHDWSATPLGPVSGWPQSLKTAVRIILGSRYPMFIWWGRQLINLYNDGYLPMLGQRHPAALGKPAAVIWSEIWDTVGPQTDAVLNEGHATWNEERLLVMERNGYREEAYFTFSYSPVPADDGGVGGIFCALTEDTQRILSQRRMRTLRELSARTMGARTVEQACQAAIDTLAQNPQDVPFALIYLRDDQGQVARLACMTGLADDSPAHPASIDLMSSDGPTACWPLDRVLAAGRAELVEGLEARCGRLQCGVWPDPPQSAIVLPVMQSGQDRLAGFLVAGISPRRVFDDDYRGFMDLLAGHIATAIANARAYDEEKRRAEALADIDRAKTLFFSNVSHEFRTPLTLMLGPVEDLLVRGRTDLSPAAVEQLDIVYRNGQRLLRLVNMLLDFSRIEAGRVRAVYQPTDLAAFTADLASVFRSAVERAGLRLSIECPPLREPVFVDPAMWEQIVLNLLSNAFKFTFEGEIAVTLQRVDDVVELRVRDTGTGIPPEEMPRVFERFHRVHNARGRTHEGSGIGLALVQELVRLHGGSIVAESVVGKGTTFTVTVPLGSAHLPPDQIGEGQRPTLPGTGATPYVQEAVRWLPESRDEGRGMRDEEIPALASSLISHPSSLSERPRVLVADDNADMRQYVTRLLAQAYRTEAVNDGEAALAAARRQRPDLILADVMMPRLDGFGLLRAIRADPELSSLPVILLSARAGEESRVEGLEAGADDYLVKPFSARELLAHVSGHLQMARLRRESDRRKDEFLAVLAHELRNPLAPIRNALQIIRLSPDRQALDQARALMERQLGQMVRLVDDLMDVSRISRGKVELRKEQIELAPVVQQAIETSRPLIEAMGHALTLDMPPAPILVNGDSTRLAQAFANLLNNAAKYTERGGRITLRVERQGSDAMVSVRDTGIGIPAHMLPRVFEMFTQVDGSLERSQGGLGIGLSLVKALVEMHGGGVEARSAGHGKGSEFIVRLPVTLADPQRSNDAGRTPTTLKARRRILVADDNRDSAHSLALLLKLMGNDTHTAHDGLEVLEAAASFRPDVILLDIGMPKLNGYEAARRIREQPWAKNVVLVAQTGWGQEDDRRLSMEAGFDIHMVKPVDPAALEELLAALPADTG